MGVAEFQHSTPPLPALPAVIPMNGAAAHPVPGPTGLPVFPSPIYTNFSGNEATQGGDSRSPRDAAEGNYLQHPQQQHQQVPPNYPVNYPPVMSGSTPHTPVASSPGYQYVPPLSVVPMHSNGASISWAQHPQQLPPPQLHHQQQQQQVGNGYPYFPTPSPPLPQAIPLAMGGAVGFPPVNPGEMPFQQFGMYPGGLPPPYLHHNGYSVHQGHPQAPPPFAYYPVGPSPSSSPSHAASQGNNVHYSHPGYSYSAPPVNDINHVDYEQQQVYPNHQSMHQRNYQHGGGRGQVDHNSNHSRANHSGAFPRGPNPNSPRRSGEQHPKPN
jgi:hypothetical protein